MKLKKSLKSVKSIPKLLFCVTSLIIILTIGLFACQKPLEIDYPEIEPKLVVNCTFTQDSLVKLKLMHTSQFDDTVLHFVDDAKCEIWQNETLFDELQNIENGYYIGTKYPEPDINYNLKIEHNIYENISAQSYCPEKSEIINIYKEDFVYPVESDINMENRKYSVLNLNFIDNKQMGNYYFVSLKARQYYSIEDEQNKWTDINLKSYSEFVKNEEILEFEPEYLIFNNSLFENAETKIEVLYLLNWWGSMGDGQTVVYSYGSHQINYKFGNISKEYYLYLKSLLKHKFNQNSEIFYYQGDPVQMYTNIENGYGIFAGYNIIEETITDTVPEWY